MGWVDHPGSGGVVASSRACFHKGQLYSFTRDEKRREGVLRVYHETASTWTEVACGPFAGGFTMTSLGDSILIAGGRSRGFEKWDTVKLSSCWLYNTVRGTGRLLELCARYAHSAVEVTFGHRHCVAVFGGQLGHQKYCNDLTLLGPFRTKSAAVGLEVPACVFTGSSPSPRSGHGAAQLHSTMFISGGQTHGNKPCNDLYQCDLATMCWRELLSPGTHPPPRRGLLHSSDVFVIDRNTALCRLMCVGAEGTCSIPLREGGGGVRADVGAASVSALTSAGARHVLHYDDSESEYLLALPAKGGLRYSAVPTGGTALQQLHAPKGTALPSEVWGAVLCYCDAVSLVRIGGTSRFLHRAATADALWEVHVDTRFGSFEASCTAKWATSLAGAHAAYAQLRGAQKNLRRIARESHRTGRTLSLRASKLRSQTLNGANRRVSAAAASSTAQVKRVSTLPGRVTFIDGNDLVLYNVADKGGRPDTPTNTLKIPINNSSAGSRKASGGNTFANGSSTCLTSVLPATREVAFFHAGRCVDVIDTVTGGLSERTDRVDTTGTAVKLARNWVVMADCGGTTHLWSRRTHRFEKSLPGHDGGARHILWDVEGILADRRHIHTCGDDGNIFRTDIEAEKVEKRQLPPHWSVVGAVAAHGREELLVAGHKGVCHVDFRTDDLPTFMNTPSQVTAMLAVSEFCFLANSQEDCICLWDVRKKGVAESLDVGSPVGSIVGTRYSADATYPEAVACTLLSTAAVKIWPTAPSRAGQMATLLHCDLGLPSAPQTCALDPVSLTVLTHASVLRIDLSSVK